MRADATRARPRNRHPPGTDETVADRIRPDNGASFGRLSRIQRPIHTGDRRVTVCRVLSGFNSWRLAVLGRIDQGRADGTWFSADCIPPHPASSAHLLAGEQGAPVGSRRFAPEPDFPPSSDSYPTTSIPRQLSFERAKLRAIPVILCASGIALGVSPFIFRILNLTERPIGMQASYECRCNSDVRGRGIRRRGRHGARVAIAGRGVRGRGLCGAGVAIAWRVVRGRGLRGARVAIAGRGVLQ